MLCAPRQAEHEHVETFELKRDPNINIEPGQPSQPCKANKDESKSDHKKIPSGFPVQTV